MFAISRDVFNISVSKYIKARNLKNRGCISCLRHPPPSVTGSELIYTRVIKVMYNFYWGATNFTPDLQVIRFLKGIYLHQYHWVRHSKEINTHMPTKRLLITIC